MKRQERIVAFATTAVAYLQLLQNDVVTKKEVRKALGLKKK